MKRLGQGDGYAMAALLVAMSVAAILMTVALPVWKQTARRELEEELVFRGLQYTRAIRLFGQKYANAGPPNIDVLVEQRFLRKKYKDPITNDDFRPLLAGQATPGGAAQSSGSGGRGGSQPQRGTSQPGSSSLTSIGVGSSGPAGVGGIGGIGATAGGRGGMPGTQGSPGGFGPGGGVIGVASKSKAESIRLYNGRNHYDEWAFIFTPQVQAPGMPTPGGPGGPGRGGRQGPENPFGSGIGGQRGPGGNPGPGRGGQQPPPGRGTFPQSPFAPAQPILPGRGRGL